MSKCRALEPPPILSEVFSDGVLAGGEGRMTIKPFGLVGHQLVSQVPRFLGGASRP